MDGRTLRQKSGRSLLKPVLKKIASKREAECNEVLSNYLANLANWILKT
jgi:hypothetical protein